MSSMSEDIRMIGAPFASFRLTDLDRIGQFLDALIPALLRGAAPSGEAGGCSPAISNLQPE